MKLFVSSINKETKTLLKNNIRLSAIGNLNALPGQALNELNETIELTSGNTRMQLNLALSYSSRWELTEALRSIAVKAVNKEIEPVNIDEDLITKHLNTASIPDPELLIRTSGEYRISNFLLWQIAYAELYFTNKLWPDFGKEDLYHAIYAFQNRERRFGKTSEQINTK